MLYIGLSLALSTSGASPELTVSNRGKGGAHCWACYGPGFGIEILAESKGFFETT
jgi:hypothetical protein